MKVAITSVGLATSQGSADSIMSRATPRSPAKLHWHPKPWTACLICRPALGVDPALAGAARWRALAKIALEDCFSGTPPAPCTPLIVASCNGGAAGFNADDWRHAFDSATLLEGTPWEGQHLPIVSGSCNSGLHALYLARQLLTTNFDEVVVLTADILSPASHDNFEALRVLSETLSPPWQSTSMGFIPGEAAVAVRLIRAERDRLATHLVGPLLANDINVGSGLRGILAEMASLRPGLIIGQGTGPFNIDELELSALRANFGTHVPLTTPLVHFGHTLGASGLLSVALASLAQKAANPLPTLSMPARVATDGRPLANGNARADSIAISSRALSGACCAAAVSARHHPDPQMTSTWQQPCDPGPLMHTTLRRVAAEAICRRPARPPDVLITRIEEPLSPPPQAVIRERLLPSAVLEITPGFLPQLVARCWGFAGAALCLVGDNNTDRATVELVRACRDSGLGVSVLNLQGTGDDRELEWNI
jgi:hypothetical protein